MLESIPIADRSSRALQRLSTMVEIFSLPYYSPSSSFNVAKSSFHTAGK